MARARDIIEWARAVNRDRGSLDEERLFIPPRSSAAVYLPTRRETGGGEQTTHGHTAPLESEALYGSGLARRAKPS